MTNIIVIKTEKDHREGLAQLEELMVLNPAPGTEEADKLQLLATLIENYERNNFPSSLPTPIEAIRFKMDQLDLKPVDLEEYIGSRSKVSEILSGKRPLTLKMIRALESGLGIPAKVLIQDLSEDARETVSWSTQLKAEVLSRLQGIDLQNLFTYKGQDVALTGLLRQSNYRTAPLTDKNALAAWFGCVLKKAEAIDTTIYKTGTVNLRFMQEVARLSIKDNAPVVAKDFLLKYGIILVIEPPFKGTRLDGAAIFVNANPIIGLTLRFDRLDSFWFTLMHELAHVALHGGSNSVIFYDELENIAGLEISQIEREADDLAGEALVPSDKWEISAARFSPSRLTASALASGLGVHISIVAGRIRYMTDSWSKLSKIVNEATIRDYFPGITWKK